MCPQIMSIQLPFHQLFQRKIITKHQDYTNTYAELYSFDYLSAFLVKLKASILLSQCLLNLSIVIKIHSSILSVCVTC